MNIVLLGRRMRVDQFQGLCCPAGRKNGPRRHFRERSKVESENSLSDFVGLQRMQERAVLNGGSGVFGRGLRSRK